jgi:hypothetical protein
LIQERTQLGTKSPFLWKEEEDPERKKKAEQRPSDPNIQVAAKKKNKIEQRPNSSFASSSSNAFRTPPAHATPSEYQTKPSKPTTSSKSAVQPSKPWTSSISWS